MKTETRIRQILSDKIKVRVTRRRRGPFVVRRPDGLETQHRTKAEALQRLLAEARCLNELKYEVAVLLKKVDE